MSWVLALGAAAWFLGAALLIGDGRSATIGDPPHQEVLGDPAAMAVHLVARVLFVGLALIALALVDWRHVREFFGR